MHVANEGLVLAGDRRKLRVAVTSIQTSNVDSTMMAVAFASYHAACIAFGMAPDERVRLRADFTYEFPTFGLPSR